MERAKRDRPAKTPGGMHCERCNEVFIGEEWHQFCAICVQQVANEIAVAQGLRYPKEAGHD
jgi:Zn finger protein HypA/HybF involved in hydrogenase expression